MEEAAVQARRPSGGGGGGQAEGEEGTGCPPPSQHRRPTEPAGDLADWLEGPSGGERCQAVHSGP